MLSRETLEAFGACVVNVTSVCVTQEEKAKLLYSLYKALYHDIFVAYSGKPEMEIVVSSIKETVNQKERM